MKFRLLLFVFLTGGIAQAQSIKGKLVDLVDNRPLAGATLELKSISDSSQRYGALADSTGQFQFANLPLDSFSLLVSFIGYEPFRQFVGINDSIPNLDLGRLLIPKKSGELGGVTVTARTPPAQQKGDTTQYNASQFKVNPDATTEDLIKKMPGITVDKDGTVTAQGEQVRKVTIDGREFFGDDASAALRNLPSEVVDKIQVFDRLSDQAQFTGFDDGNSQRAINVITKSGIKNGQFGRIYAGYGTDNRYSAGGNVSFFQEDRRISVVGNFNNINQQNFASQDLLGVTSSGGNRGGGNFGGRGGGGRGGGGFRGGENFSVGQQNGISKTNAIGINFSDKWGKKLNVQGSYFFNNSNNENDESLKSQTLFDDKTQYINQNSFSQSKNTNHRINLRLEYNIDSSNSLVISPSLNFQNNNSVSRGISQTLTDEDTSNTSVNDSRSLREGYNLRNNILYRHSFPKRGRTFSLNLNTTFNKNDGESFVNAHYRYFYPTGINDSLQDQYTINPTNGYSISGNIAYTEPIGEKGQLQFNYSPSLSKNNADQQTYNFEPIIEKYSIFDPSLSNKFDNTTTTHNGGITYRLGANRDDQFSVGVNFQHSKLESQRIFPLPSQVKQAFSNLLPNLQWRKKVSARSNIRIFYRANTNFPSVTQLQDVINPSNPLRVSSGNPELRQSYTHFVSGRYTFNNTQKGQSFFANIFIQTAQDYISNATYSPRQDSVIQGVEIKANTQFVKPVNLDGYKNLRTFFTYGMPVKFIKSNINLNTGFTYSQLPGLVDYVKTKTDNYVFNAGIVIASNISEYVDFNLSYNASFNNTRSSVQEGTNRFVNQAAGFQLNLLSKSGWFIQNDISNQQYSGDGINETFTLWNAGAGKKFLKNRVGELKLTVFDLLKQNQSVYRTVTENRIEDSQSNVLQQFFMLTFTYSLKNFGKPAAPNRQRMDRVPMF
ncbi:MAG TPA: outer membrane beta-barrel protein [Chitinophagaceae bacterium]|nr:outer membrane beta-barrel protein [Chitinophagaceae bacterium]